MCSRKPGYDASRARLPNASPLTTPCNRLSLKRKGSRRTLCDSATEACRMSRTRTKRKTDCKGPRRPSGQGKIACLGDGHSASRSRLSLGRHRRLEVAFGEGDKRRPVRRRGVAAAMLAERHVAIHQTRLDGREFGGPHVLFAQEFVDGPGGGRGHEAAFGVRPAVARGGAGADEY